MASRPSRPLLPSTRLLTLSPNSLHIPCSTYRTRHASIPPSTLARYLTTSRSVTPYASTAFSNAQRLSLSRVTQRLFHNTFANLQAQASGRPTDAAESVQNRDTASTQEQAQDNAKSPSEEDHTRDHHESKDQDKEGQQEGKEKGKQGKKEEPPPPPPHGNKTPWQVFTETLKTEFQASKEWNESTKALASSAHQFSESESVKRARAAYEAASGAATSTTGTALRGTGRAIGKTAAWTWDTPVVKGVRTGVHMTGRAIEAGTRPVRETEVYKKAVGNVKDVIDDGSSSRYGGWIEKEERRKKREAREASEALASGRPGKRVEKMEEDPKYATILNAFPTQLPY
jgi:import inner membrane translocase subunit TIM44